MRRTEKAEDSKSASLISAGKTTTVLANRMRTISAAGALENGTCIRAVFRWSCENGKTYSCLRVPPTASAAQETALPSLGPLANARLVCITQIAGENGPSEGT